MSIFNIGGNPELTRAAAYRVISVSQDEPDHQLLGMGLAFYASCRALNIDIKQALISLERMHDDLDGPFVGTLRALEEYAKNELR